MIRRDSFNEMANIDPRTSGLRYNVWIDSAGKLRRLSHNKPRVKIVDGRKELSIEIAKGELNVLAGNPKKFTDLGSVEKFINLVHDILMDHWNQKLSDTIALIAIHNVCKKGMSVDDAIAKAEEEYN